MTYDYFYGQQAEMFAFYRVPKVLFTEDCFWNVSTDAKLLYGILLDRMNLSARNGWLDEEGRVYIIFTIEEIKGALGCAEKKAVKLLDELEKKCGLIERKRQGLGKPNLIYVKNFISGSVERQFLNCQKDNSGVVKNTIQELSKAQGNNTDTNYIDFSDTDPFFPSGFCGKEVDETDEFTRYYHPSDGYTKSARVFFPTPGYLLTDEQKKQVEFVQFHPSYDYSDFVEGLRPKVNDDGTMGFELQDGIFKKFVARARKNYEDSQKSRETVEKELSVQEAMAEFFASVELGVDTFKTINGNEFTIISMDDSHINISIPGNATVNKLSLNLDEVRRMLESGLRFEKIKDITTFFGKSFATQAYSYDFAIYKAIKAKKGTSSKVRAQQTELKKYIFIIDEINRGEISKIFGELFFAIDPGYRGRSGEISTQYSNLHPNPDEKFYIPENVYIIGTMNDIDRSVDSFDFAMRRRFRFVELRADERLEMLALLENEELEAEAIRRMAALNKEIATVEDLNENYQIGASYFLKLKTLDFDQLWTDYLQPLLQEYIQGMYDEEGIMKRFAKAYGYQNPSRGDVHEATQNQG